MQDPAQKKIFVIFIVVVFAFVVYWVVAFALPHAEVSSSVTSLSSSSSTMPPSFQENALGTIGGIGGIVSSTQNLTKNLITDVGNEIVSSMKLASSTNKEDLLGAIQKSGITSLDDATLQKYVTPDKLGLVQDIPDSALHIGTDNSPQAITTYKNLFITATTPLSDIMSASSSVNTIFTSFMKNGSTEKLDNLIQTYQNIYNTLQKTTVPPKAVLLHKNAMKFFVNSSVIFLGIRGYQNDPLKAYILSEQMGDLPTVWNQVVDQFKLL